MESSTNRVQHKINMLNVDKLEQVREASPLLIRTKRPPLSLLLDARRASNAMFTVRVCRAEHTPIHASLTAADSEVGLTEDSIGR